MTVTQEVELIIQGLVAPKCLARPSLLCQMLLRISVQLKRKMQALHRVAKCLLKYL